MTFILESLSSAIADISGDGILTMSLNLIGVFVIFRYTLNIQFLASEERERKD